MMTAAVRDLHLSYPGEFETDVRTACPAIWEHNPYITPLREGEAGVEEIDCSYPLIDRCDTTPYHCLHGFIHFLNEQLQLCIKPTVFKGDIHLSKQEQRWYSQVHELTGVRTPFWIVAAGGKYDITIKWWKAERYQQVIDHFRGKILFVQVGEIGHHHPKLEGTIDLRGKTTLRELIRLVYHADGVLCPVTGLMHLAAAVPLPSRRKARRACVVVAGGREPAHWEAYPGHQYIHMNSALECCGVSGCWRDRTFRLRDGDPRDRRSCLCLDVVGNLPRCMAMITPEMVIQRIETYYTGRALKFLPAVLSSAALRGIRTSSRNKFDRQPLNLHSAAMACERFIQAIPEMPNGFRGAGIVVCGGGRTNFPGAWVCIKKLRWLGCELPIQFWHLGKSEMSMAMKGLMGPLGVECVDAFKVRRRFPATLLGESELKPYSILHSPFEQVLLLDAQNVPVLNPTSLFNAQQFQARGAVFWPDLHPPRQEAVSIWRNCGLRLPQEATFETGQILVNKRRCWPALKLAMWFNENSDFYHKHLHGNKDTFHLAFRKLRTKYHLVTTPAARLPDAMCQHDFEGRVLFQRRNTTKWSVPNGNHLVGNFRFEEVSLGFLRQLNGRLESLKTNLPIKDIE